MSDSKLIQLTPYGLYSPVADIFIDPWRPVDKAVISHAHSDHARWGMKSYLAHSHSQEVMKLRLGNEISLQTVSYNKVVKINGVSISLHPAGHIPGSSQIRLEYHGKITVVSGDYKLENDGLSEPFEPVKCHEYVSECTFGLPIYKWQPQHKVFENINQWWRGNAENNRNSVIFAYSLGKAQRILNNLETSIGEVFVHGAIWNTNQALLANGVKVVDAEKVTGEMPKSRFRGALIMAPPSAMGAPWLKKFIPFRTAICSGWMNVRGAKRRRAADTGFVLSDHADWEGLITAIKSTGAEKVYLTHGNTAVFGRYLEEIERIKAVELETLFQGENINLDDN